MGKNQDPGSGINIPDPQHWSSDGLTMGREIKQFMEALILCGYVSRSGLSLFVPKPLPFLWQNIVRRMSGEVGN
jgi:hypothetical protein